MSPTGGPVDQLVFAGSTTHYNFFYPANHVTLGIEPGLINEVMAHVEDDYALLEEYFGSFPALTNIYVQIYDSSGGGGINFLDDGAGGTIILIRCQDNDFPYPETLRAMIFHETGHAFEWQTDIANGVDGSDSTGWFFSDAIGGTRSETLCRFLHSIFLAEHLEAADTGWLSRNYYGVTQLWLNSVRADYVNTAAVGDGAPSAETGCGVLFLYYLRDQLGYTVPQIIAAGRLADTLADIYHTLTGDSADPFPRFKGLIDGGYPSLVRSGIVGPNPENPWPIGAPVLTDALPGGVLIVQAAWGADPALNDTLWSWEDITRDVRQSDGATLALTAGRTDEASDTQPATAAMLLDNRSGRYALGGQNPLYPYVRRNTPIRVSLSVDHGLTWSTLFFGYADGWAPDWDATGRDATVKLTASGVLRRLLQGDPPSISPMRRYIESTTSSLPIVYWPMEDGASASSFAAAIGDTGGQYVMVPTSESTAPPKPAANSDFITSFPLPTVGNCELYAPVPWRPSTGTLALTLLIGLPDSGIPADQPLVFLDVSGSSDWWWIAYGETTGNLAVWCEDRFGTTKVHDEFNLGGLDGKRGLLQFELTESGSNVTYALRWLEQGTYTIFSGTGTCTSRTLGRAQAVWLNTHFDSVDDGVAPAEVIAPTSAELVIGHVAVRDVVPSLSTGVADVLAGYAGESTGGRLTRLLTENGLNVAIYSAAAFLPATPRATEAEIMGPQSIAPVLDLLREVEAVDGGILLDGISRSLAFMPRIARLSRPADLTLDVAKSQLLDPLHPDDDDQRTVNRVVVKRVNGSSISAQDTDGPLGSATVGLYESQVEVNTYTDGGAAQQAAWRVHAGTAVGYRYPQITFDLAKNPELATAWLGCPVGGRIDVVNLLDARTQHPGGDMSLCLEGYTQQIDQKRWTVVANCSLFDPWLVGQVADSQGKGQGPYHVDSAASVLAEFTPEGATELRVTVTDGPAWSTDTADYPLTLDVGGMPVSVEACTAAETFPALNPVVVGDQLADDFDDNEVDTGLWPVSAGTYTEASGLAQVTAVTAGTASYYESAAAYTLADSTLTAKISPPSLQDSTTAEVHLAMYDPASGYTTAVMMVGRVSTGPTYTLGCYAQVNGQVAVNVFTGWTPGTFPWVRLRERAGSLFFEAGADGVNWLTLLRVATPVALRESNTLSVVLEAARTTATTPGTPATFDDMSLTRTSRDAQTFTIGGGLIMDDFADGAVNTGLWAYSLGTYSESGDGTVRVTATTDGIYNGLLTGGRYNLRDVTLTGRLVAPSAEDSATFARAYLSCQVGSISSNVMQVYIDSVAQVYGFLCFIDGVQQWHVQGALSGFTALWMRLVTASAPGGDTVTLQIAVDGGVWTSIITESLGSVWTTGENVAVGLLAARSAATTAGDPAQISNVRFERNSYDQVLTAKQAGSAVTLWRPPILAL